MTMIFMVTMHWWRQWCQYNKHLPHTIPGLSSLSKKMTNTGKVTHKVLRTARCTKYTIWNSTTHTQRVKQDPVSSTVRYKMMKYKVIPVGTWWYWVSILRYWLVLGITGSALGPFAYLYQYISTTKKWSFCSLSPIQIHRFCRMELLSSWEVGVEHS